MHRYWHPFADMGLVGRDGPLTLVRGSGSTVVDAEGNEYLDATAGLWFCNVGHGRREIGDAVATQMSELAAYSTFGDLGSPATYALADRVVASSPMPDGVTVLTSGGSDAIDSALKLVAAYWDAVGEPRRRTVIHRSSAYHGMHLGGTSLAGIPNNRSTATTDALDRVEVPWDDAPALEAAITEHDPRTVAAFFCEPVIGAGGVFPPPPDYLVEVERICRRYSVVLVLDEVITGFGRCGEWFASTRFGITPDIITFAKGVTSGYIPLGGLVVGPRIADPFWTTPDGPIWRHGYTYSGHAAACTGALANLDILEAEGLLGRGRELETSLDRTLRDLTTRRLVSEVRIGDGALAAIQLDPDVLAHDPGTGPRVVAAARRRGVLTRLLAGGSLQVSPALCTTDEEISSISERIADALEDADQRA